MAGYKFSLRLIFAFSVSLLIWSCEEIPVIIPDYSPPETGKTVLIEDLTGVRCPNCPRGAAALENILAKYEGKVFAIAIHGIQLVTPLPQSKYDFRNQFAADLEKFHQPFLGKPSALINRKKFDNQSFIPVDVVDLWLGYTEQELALPQEVQIDVDYNYNSDTRQLKLLVGVSPLKNAIGEFKISVFLTESHIIDYQETSGAILSNFEHNHVLRHMLTRFDGDALSDQLKTSEVINRNYTYTIPEEFIAENMEVIVAVHKADPDDKTVIQTAGIKIGK